MTSAYRTQKMVTNNTSQAVPQSQAAQFVSEQWAADNNDSLYLAIQIDCSSVVVAAAITAKLFHSIDGTNFSAVGAAAQIAITTNGRFVISLSSDVVANSGSLPLWPYLKVAVTTGAGDSLNVDQVWVARHF